ncbi:MAG: DUF4325 domain-containing protein [Bacteroidota bacterium]|nr:DUF4325 domain-containing protein [Bacteroidota bacterium]MDP4236911.1 DUF4325 domain-containing protein [Bacteroidota bacterium]
MYKKSEEIRQFIIENVEAHRRNIASVAADKFHLTRQAINKQIRKLVEEKILSEEGSTRAKIYKLFQHILETKDYANSPDLSEDRVYAVDVLPKLKEIGVAKNLEQRCAYFFTEIFNNAIDHSEGSVISISVTYDERYITIAIKDNGVGIFRKIMKRFELEDERAAILELSKGKLTTDPAKHTGEGIFFSSRISDRFVILSHQLTFLSAGSEDVQIELKDDKLDGTLVSAKFLRSSDRTTKEVFDKYASGDSDYGFAVTHIPVRLAQIGEENLLSRSQAKRLLARLDRFKEVAFDFEGVAVIGQSFADQIFRVFQNEHPDIHLWYFNANEAVTQMISRALFAKTEGKQEARNPLSHP